MNNAPGIDVSLWDGGPSDNLQVIDFTKYKTAFPFIYIKISEGTVKDPLFDRQWAASKGHVVRMAYSFFRSFVDQKIAVQRVVEWLGNDAGEMPVCLDAEKADGSDSVMSKMKVWADEYQRLTGLMCWIYSRNSFMFENGSAKKTLGLLYKNAWLRNHPYICAEYPFDELESMSGYVERGDALRAILVHEVLSGTRIIHFPTPVEPFQRVDIWQWTSRMRPQDVPGYYLGPNHKLAVDHNFYYQTVEEFKAKFQVSSTPTTPPSIVDLVTMPYPGVVVTKGRRFDSDVQIVAIDRASIQDAIVTAPQGFHFIDSIAGDIVSNGGDYDVITGHPIGLLKSRGIPYAPQAGSEPALGFNADNSAEIRHDKTSWPNAVGVKRYILVNGEVSTSTSDAWYNREPRTIFGSKSDGSLVILSVKGRDAYNAGHNLFEAAQVMREFGCQTAGDGDGGGSTQARVKGEIFLGTLEHRAVADHISITIKLENVPSTGGNVKGTAKFATNIKATVAGQVPAVLQLQTGQYAYGTLIGGTATGDLTGFNHFYRADGSRVELGCVCKAFAGNLTLINELEPTAPPEPPPPTSSVIVQIEVVYSDGIRKVFVPQ